MSKLTFQWAVLAALLASCMAIHCKTGVNEVMGPVVDCQSNQCLNTSTPDTNMFSCDYSNVCDMIRLRDECVKEGDKITCCCFSEECNVGQLTRTSGFKQTVMLKDPAHHDMQPLC